MRNTTLVNEDRIGKNIQDWVVLTPFCAMRLTNKKYWTRSNAAELQLLLPSSSLDQRGYLIIFTHLERKPNVCSVKIFRE